MGAVKRSSLFLATLCAAVAGAGLVAGCGGGGSEAVSTAGPDGAGASGAGTLSDGLPVDGVAPGTTRFAGEYFGSGVAVGGDGQALAVFQRGTWLDATRGTSGAWSTPAPVAAEAWEPRLTGNAAGRAVLSWRGGGRHVLSTFDPTSATWSAPIDDGEAGRDPHGGIRVLGDGTTAWARAGRRGWPSVLYDGASIVSLAASGSIVEALFPTPAVARSEAQAMFGAADERHLLTRDTEGGREVVRWHVLDSASAVRRSDTIATADSLCWPDSTGLGTRNVHGAFSDGRIGVAAFTRSRTTPETRTSCELILAPRRSGVLQEPPQRMTPADRHVVDVPIVAAGGALAMALWKEEGGGPGAWSLRWSASVLGAPFTESAPVPGAVFARSRAVGQPAVVVNEATSVATVAVPLADTNNTPPLRPERLVVANYDPNTGWTPWRLVFSGDDVSTPALGIGPSGDVVLAYTAAACQRVERAFGPGCNGSGARSAFVLRNP